MDRDPADRLQLAIASARVRDRREPARSGLERGPVRAAGRRERGPDEHVRGPRRAARARRTHRGVRSLSRRRDRPQDDVAVRQVDVLLRDVRDGRDAERAREVHGEELPCGARARLREPRHGSRPELGRRDAARLRADAAVRRQRRSCRVHVRRLSLRPPPRRPLCGGRAEPRVRLRPVHPDTHGRADGRDRPRPGVRTRPCRDREGPAGPRSARSGCHAEEPVLLGADPAPRPQPAGDVDGGRERLRVVADRHDGLHDRAAADRRSGPRRVEDHRPVGDSAAGMTSALLAWTGEAHSLDEFVEGFATLGGSAPPTADAMRPLLEYIYSLRAPTNPMPPDPALVASGAALYRDKGSATCHDGPRGSGTRAYTFAEIGTDPALAGWADPTQSGSACCGLDIEPGQLTHGVKSPRLVGTWALGRILHDGALTSLDQLFCQTPRPPTGTEPMRSDGHAFTCDV